MTNFPALLLGEIQRMWKYNIMAASLLVALIWIGVLHFTGLQDVSRIFPLLIYLDATSMSMLFVGVKMFFEKQEGTFKTLLVSPISKAEYILSKTSANIFSNIETLLFLYLYAKLFKNIDVNILGLLGGVVLIAFFHSLIGFILTYYSKDFTELLMGMMKYAFIFMVPVLFEQVGIIQVEVIKKLLYALPTKVSMLLLQASTGNIASRDIYFSVAYLLLASVLAYLVVSRKFDEFAVREGGV